MGEIDIEHVGVVCVPVQVRKERLLNTGHIFLSGVLSASLFGIVAPTRHLTLLNLCYWQKKICKCTK